MVDRANNKLCDAPHDVISAARRNDAAPVSFHFPFHPVALHEVLRLQHLKPWMKSFRDVRLAILA
jgi:hypothetical protein